jgi:hypothetical protein
MARYARSDVRRGAAVFVESVEIPVPKNQSGLDRFVGFSCKSAAQTSRRGSRL